MRSLSAALGGFVAVLALQACPTSSSPPPPRNQLLGRVAISGALNVSGVSILLTGPQTLSGTTDVLGRIAFQNLFAGTYQVTVRASSTREKEQTATVDVPETGTASVGPFFFTGVGPLSGQVMLQQWEPLAGLHVDVPGHTATTDANGLFFFDEVDAGPVSISVTIPGITWSHEDSAIVQVGIGTNILINVEDPPPDGIPGVPISLSQIWQFGDIETDGATVLATGGDAYTGVLALRPHMALSHLNLHARAPGDLYIDQGTAYAADLGDENRASTGSRWMFATGTGGIVSMPLAGGDTVTIATGQTMPRSITGNSSSLFWVNQDHNAQGIPSPSDSTHLMQCPKDLSSAPAALEGTDGAYSVAADEDTLYWTRWLSDDVLSRPIAGGDTSTIAAYWRDARVFFDSGHLYISGADALGEVPPNGGAVVTLIQGEKPNVIGGVAYWADEVAAHFFIRRKTLPDSQTETLYESPNDFSQFISSKVVAAGPCLFWIENGSQFVQYRIPSP